MKKEIEYTGIFAGISMAVTGMAMVLAPVAAMAQSGGVDYSSLTSAVSFSSTITAILAVGALAVTLALAVTGVRKILRMVRGA